MRFGFKIRLSSNLSFYVSFKPKHMIPAIAIVSVAYLCSMVI